MVAQRVITQVVDDLDGRELGPDDGETVTFGVDGVSYEIDLSKKNARKLRNALEPFIAAGRRTGGRSQATGAGRGRRSRSRASTDGGSRAAVSTAERGHIRSWAQANGYDVSARGRLSQKVIEAYLAADG